MKGSIQKRGNKWCMCFRFQGKQKTLSTGLDATETNKTAATVILKDTLEKYTALEKSNIPPSLIDISFIKYLDFWLEQVKGLVKPSTFEGYQKTVSGKIQPYFKHKKYKLNDLKPMYFTEYYNYLKQRGGKKGQGLSKKTITNIRAVLLSAIGYAVENDLIDSNVILKSHLPKFDTLTVKKHNIYSPEQCKLLLSYAEQTQSKACLFLYLVLSTGCRKGELLGLTWNNVDLDNSTIHICYNRTGNRKENYNTLLTPKTENSNRILPIPQKVLAMLKVEKDKQEQFKQLLGNNYKMYEADYVIRQNDGTIYNPNSINRIIRKMTEKIGLPHCTIHEYRHAVASILDNGGVALQDITTQLGHSQTSTTDTIYIHRNRVAKQSNTQLLSNAMGL